MNTYKYLRALIIFFIISGWIFSGWPQIWLLWAQETLIDQLQIEEPEVDEENAPEEITQPQEPAPPPAPPLKERKLNKEIKIAKNAGHSCRAKNFHLDLSGQNETIVEFELNGQRSDVENIEIGSLPLGIDITFLSNGNYTYAPGRGDGVFVLQIVNQPGSQKGNFSIPIVYASGDSTTICQINIINF